MNSKRRIITEKIVNLLLNILIFIFGLILFFSLYISVQTKILGNDYPNFFGYSIFEVQTGSMADTINPGDWIIVKLTDNVKIKDIITYKLNNEYITHRIIEQYNGTYVTKGDANNSKDEPIDQKQVVGKVIKILANYGIVRKVFFNPAVLIMFILTLLLFNLTFSKNKDNKLNTILRKFLGDYIKRIENNKKNKSDKENRRKELVNSSKQKEEKIEVLDKELLYDMFSKPSNGETEYNNEDLEKTAMFRVVPVDISEIDDTFLEIAKNELKEPKTEEVIEEIIEEIEEEDLTQINLDLLKNKMKKKKSKNIIDKVISVKEEELKELISLLGDKKELTSKEEVRDIFITAYIEGKYYNHYGDKNIEYQVKNIVTKMEKVINDVSKELTKDSQDKNIVDVFAKIFLIIANLEHARDSITSIKAKREFFKKTISKYFNDYKKKELDDIIEEIIKIQRNYLGIIDYFFKKLETNMFNLTLNKIVNNNCMFGTELKHNVSFNKAYSEYIIDKTYSEGIIAEDKISVLLNLLSIRLIKDMLAFNFRIKYIVYMPDSLYDKEKKLERFLKMIDDEYAKSNVIILTTFSNLLNNKLIIKKARKMGYKFALTFEDNDIIEEKDLKYLYMVNYIFANKKAHNMAKIMSLLPEELAENIIYEDIYGKVGDFRSE